MLRFLFLASSLALLLGATTQMTLPPQPRVHPVGIPRNAVRVSPCVATMGEHWASLRDLPNGPIYGVWQGKPVFTEIMVSVVQLQHGFSWADIRPLPGYRIDHVDFEFEPHGHPGFPVPHYDVHMYYISYAAQLKICPHGLPDSAMKPTRIGV
jgi:hypothetical protein